MPRLLRPQAKNHEGTKKRKNIKKQRCTTEATIKERPTRSRNKLTPTDQHKQEREQNKNNPETNSHPPMRTNKKTTKRTNQNIFKRKTRKKKKQNQKKLNTKQNIPPSSPGQVSYSSVVPMRLPAAWNHSPRARAGKTSRPWRPKSLQLLRKLEKRQGRREDVVCCYMFFYSFFFGEVLVTIQMFFFWGGSYFLGSLGICGNSRLLKQTQDDE